MWDSLADPVFDSGPGATISSGMKVLTKQGRVVIAEGYVGLLRENGDLIASAPVASVELKKGLTYSMTSIPKLIVGGKKYQVMLSWEKSINSGLGDEQAKEIQFIDNEEFGKVLRSLGGKA